MSPRILSAVSLALLAQTVAGADSLRLVGGDVLQGTIVAESADSVTLDHAALGRIEVARDRIAAIERTAPVADASQDEPAAKPTAVLPAPEPPSPQKPDGSWKFSLSLGLSGSRNDESSNWDYRVAGTARRETEADRTTVSSEYYYKTADGVETDNNFLLKVLEEYMFRESRWEGFGQVVYQNDNFQDWEQRIGMYAGPGYRLIDTAEFKLKLRGGAGASYEVPTETWTPELLFGDDLVWTIDARSKLVQGFEIYPDLEQTGEYRFIARLEYETALTEKQDIKATAGLRDEFDSFVEPTGDSTNDLKMFVGLKYAF